LSQASVGNVSNVLKELAKVSNRDESKRKGSPKKDKEKEPDARKDSPKKKTDEALPKKKTDEVLMNTFFFLIVCYSAVKVIDVNNNDSCDYFNPFRL